MFRVVTEEPDRTYNRQLQNFLESFEGMQLLILSSFHF